MPKVSVIIPVYNMEKWISECLDTVITQTLEDIEIICINDGSVDKSEDIIRSYMEKDARIVLLNQENKGVATARNNGLNNATGEYVVFMDPDDWYPDNETLEVMYETAVNNNVKICGGSFSEQVGDKLVTEFTGNKKKYTFDKEGIMKYSDYQYDYGYHRFVYKLDFLKENNIYFPLYIRFQDPPFFVKAMITAGEFYAIKRITYRYRVATQKIIWTEAKLNDLLKGLTDLLNMSNKHGLKELHANSLTRMGKIYLDMYASALPTASNEMLHALEALYNAVNLDLLENRAEYKLYAKSIEKLIYKAKVVDNILEGPVPKVSVIIPVYNVEEYIRECLASVMQQTLKNIEIIVVNDGTRDNSIQVIEDFIANDSRIKLVEKENGGLSSARNYGLLFATGEYVLFLDSDDYLSNNALYELYAYAKANKIDELFYNAESFFEGDAEKKNSNYKNYYNRNAAYSSVYTGQALFVAFMKNDDFKPSACLQMLNRSFLIENNLKFYEGILHEDNLFTLQCLLNAKSCAYIDVPFYKRRVHSDSIMTNPKGIRNSYGYFITIIELINILEKCNVQLNSDYKVQLTKQIGKLLKSCREWVYNVSPEELNEFIYSIPFEKRVLYKILVLDYNEVVRNNGNKLIVSSDSKILEQINSNLKKIEQISSNSNVSPDSKILEQINNNLKKIEQMSSKLSNEQANLAITFAKSNYKQSPYVIRKIRGGVQCYKDHGFRYTVRRIIQKIKNKLSK